MTYTFIYARGGCIYEQEYDNLDELYHDAWLGEEYGEHYSLELKENEKVIYSDRQGVPWTGENMNFHDAIENYAEAKGWAE